MAENEKLGDACHISIIKAENGWKISCTLENKEMSLAQKAGWVPCGIGQCKDYVEKTKDSVLKRLKELL